MGLAAAVASLAVAYPAIPGRAGRLDPPSNRPNILIVMADDQAMQNFTRTLMPTVFSELVDKGVTFNRAYDTSGLCCPSRAEILTGLYEQHTGVDTNSTGLSRPTIVQTLRDLGYRTSLTGKYLNSWPCDARPEFDQWVCVGSGQSSYSLTDPMVNLNGTWQRITGYTTDILASYAVDFINSTPTDQPFFEMYTPTSPHLPANDPRCATIPVTPWRPPSYNEDTTSDGKPAYEQRPALSPSEVQWFDQEYKVMTQAVPCLDTSISTVLDSLGSREQNTLVIYMSDNGFLYGEHRRRDKEVAYEEADHVPLVIRYPALVPEDQPFATDALVNYVDIASTIADLLQIKWGADGLSVVPLLTQQSQSIRDGTLLEHCQGVNYPCTPPYLQFGISEPPSINAIVTAQYKYIENYTGEKELYDLTADPYELVNLDGNPSYQTTEADLATELAALRAPPPTDTTIATGPQGMLDSRVASFTYFSQSRLATYQCRLDVNGVPGVWAPCGAGGNTVGPLADGDYTFEVYGTDEYGVADPAPDTRSFTVSSSGPDASIASAPPPLTKDTTLSFGFSSQTPGATFQCELSPYPGPLAAWSACDPGSGVSYGPLTDGTYLFQVQAIDGFGVASDPPASSLVVIRNSGPQMSFTNAPASRTRATTAAFTFVPDEPTTGTVYCKLDQTPKTACASSYTTGTLAAGKHTLRVTATDGLGNVKTTSFTWTVDITAPTLTATGPAPYTKQSQATFTFRPSETLDGSTPYTCALDGGNLVYGLYLNSACAGRTTIKGLADGLHTLQVQVQDAAGNLSSVLTWTWTVDRVAPVTTIDSGPADGSSTTATFTFSATDATPVTFSCSLDGQAATTCVSGVTYTGLAQGSHSFSVFGTDAAGNVGLPATWSWTITP